MERITFKSNRFNRVNVNVNKYINSNVNDNVVIQNYDIPNFQPKNEKETIALKTAEEFKDRENLKLYIKAINVLGIRIFQRIAENVREKPKEQIKKSRGAFFAYLYRLEKKH